MHSQELRQSIAARDERLLQEWRTKLLATNDEMDRPKGELDKSTAERDIAMHELRATVLRIARK